MAEQNTLTDIFPDSQAVTQRMLEVTQRLADINSGSWNREGIALVQQGLAELFEPLSDSYEQRQGADISRMEEDGEESLFTPNPIQIFRARPEAPLQLVMTGHSDTVFPKDSHFRSCKVEEGLLKGPGTADMKGGLVVLAEALKWLDQSPFKDEFGFTVIISPDEETGSLSSAPVLMELAKSAHYGMTYEPALPDGTLAGARKGSGNFTLTARGLSTHAGRNFFDGRNAVMAIARASVLLSELTSEADGITVNIGRIQGGGAVNVVPDFCQCRFNIRVDTPEQMTRLEAEIADILQQLGAETGCELSLHGGFNRPPKPMTPAQQSMFELLKECGLALGLDIQWRATGGCCEGNNLAAAGLVNIDTLGVRGANIHTDQEYTCIDSFAERAALSILLIQKLIQRQKESSSC